MLQMRPVMHGTCSSNLKCLEALGSSNLASMTVLPLLVHQLAWIQAPAFEATIALTVRGLGEQSQE